jgi:hypothetical protein
VPDGADPTQKKGEGTADGKKDGKTEGTKDVKKDVKKEGKAEGEPGKASTPTPEPAAREPEAVFAPRARPAWTIPLPGSGGLVPGTGQAARPRALLRGPEDKLLFWDDEGRAWTWGGGDRPPPRVPLVERGARDRVTRAAWANETRIVIADAERFVRLGYSPDRPWNIVFRSEQPIDALCAWEKDGVVQVAIAAGPGLWLASARGGEPTRVQLPARILDVCRQPNGALLALTTDKILKEPFAKEPEAERLGIHLARGLLSEDGNLLAGVPLDDDRALALCPRGEAGRPGMHVLREGSVSAFALSADGRRVLLASTLGDLVLLDGRTAKPQCAGRVQKEAIPAVGLSADGNTAYSLDPAGAVHVWDVSAPPAPAPR